MGSGVLRDRVLGRVADQLAARAPGHPVRVAVDGVTAAGKTTLARELAAALAARGRPAVHLSMDGFHHPRAHRHRQGRDSADGYYADAYDFAAFARTVLDPLGPGGDRRYRERILDLAADTPVIEPPATAPADAVVVVDGSFLQRDLAGRWDEVVFVDTGFDVALARGRRRDAAAFGGAEPAERAFRQRYHPASRRYLAEVDPRARATVVLGNDDLDRPVLHRIGGPAGSTVNLFLAGGAAGFAAAGGGIVDHHQSRGGTVHLLSTEELAAADTRAAPDHRRCLVRLDSGLEAWTYRPRTTPTVPGS
jgi:uridine kinase